ncbi:MAG: type I-E CRISPR-associated protein Cse1/CasA [Deltaproteobacteria bacterium]|nr:type I-E CRISPR-associated protein Cse1/CasA [Deltaproteobacteria bacterium]
MNNHDFDLLIHDWIPCLATEGVLKSFSIRSALENAGDIRSIEHESPIVRIATLRLLLAFCYRVAHANGVPLKSFRNWQALLAEWSEGIPSQWIDRYLGQCQCRNKFRLFDDNYPFLQIAGLVCQGDKQPESATRLAFEQYAGTPSTLWEHLAEVPSVQEAALYLVTCQAFGASASNTSNAKVGHLEYSPTGRTFAPVYTGCIVWLEGDSLLETLMLNLVDYDLTDADLPTWEKPLSIYALRARQPQKAKDGDLDKDGKQIKIGKKLGDSKRASPTGPVQLFTWPSRAVRLNIPESGKVKTVHFTQGLALSDHSVDPMKPYDHEGQPLNLQRDKAGWRDLHSLLALQPNRNRTVLALSHAARSGLAAARINIAGIARGKDPAKILFWRHERMPVPAALLADVNLIERLGSLLENARQAASELNNRSLRMAKLYLAPESESPNGRQPDKDEVTNVAKSIDPRPAYWARLEEPFFPLLENLPNDWDTARDDWKPDDQQLASNAWRERVKGEAWRALEESIRSLGTTARAIQAVARVRTDFNDGDLMPRLQHAPKAKGKARGGKKE